MKSMMIKNDDDYQADQDADALILAAEIRNDPERLMAAKKELAGRKKHVVSSIQDLKDKSDAMDNGEDEEDDEDDSSED